MKKAVILGAGLATRLYPITHHIPKVLVNYKQHTILKNLHDIYRDLGAEEIIVVVHSKFEETVDAYARQEGLNIIIRTVDKAFGSAYALACLNSDLEGHNVVVNWCDIIPDFDCFRWGVNTIYTKGNECRYSFDGEYIVNSGKTGGNVVGIYQLKDWEFYMGNTAEEIHEYTHGRDFVDFLYGKVFKQSELYRLVDLGDMDKLEKAHKVRELNRSFNSIEINEDTVTKIALTDQGALLQKDEIQWYYNVSSKAVPQIVSHHPGGHFTMERIFGKPAFEYIQQQMSIRHPVIIDDILRAMNFGRRDFRVNDATIRQDYTKEFYDKVVDRCESIQGLIDSFGPITHVNGVRIGRLKPMLKQALEHLIQYHRRTEGGYYSLIHGDPNFSNTMITDEGEVKFIDPRGYFGNTKLYGPRLYDEAKALYAVSGYDNFNADPMWGGIEIQGEGMYVDIKPLVYKYEKLEAFNEHHHLAVAIIWIALGGYFKNNPLKAVAAYYHGMRLLTRQLRKMGRVLKDGTVSKDVIEPVTATLITKNPGKWVLTDKETGVSYRPIGGDITHQWERI